MTVRTWSTIYHNFVDSSIFSHQFFSLKYICDWSFWCAQLQFQHHNQDVQIERERSRKKGRKRENMHINAFAFSHHVFISKTRKLVRYVCVCVFYSIWNIELQGNCPECLFTFCFTLTTVTTKKTVLCLFYTHLYPLALKSINWDVCNR